MDPTACVERMMRAYDAKDYDEARWAAADLSNWLARKGFAPAATKRATEVYRAMCEWNCLAGMPKERE